ncbi:PREDICTED: protein FAR-RED ELONGATED HYPOCOTYL 3-like [Erythranthe guttata]|uniref:protein FAR-RED ELONGATED HYPOCOTYL 3-like n=1 Tax=Erythranthe guttata TaxID=4155 RepID=UPI00064DA56C|nr:PREDICTED: protein FAR-RED ELONGATED HYPOCOTYL 3-like [Erythranthe guttata]|eukprot:XP_012847440.1 PREDICTED: protein FAR-RED ELONGATED HYPOCOTYL 3-like [Erythranthe guttata]
MSSSDEDRDSGSNEVKIQSFRSKKLEKLSKRTTWDSEYGPHAQLGRDNTSRVEVDHTDYFTTTQLFDSGDELVAWARSVARALFVKLIKKSAPKIKKVCLTCDLFGGPRESNVEASSKRSGSKKIKCGFQIVGERRLDDRWGLRIVYGKHNHIPIYMSGHGLSALNEAESKIIKDLSQSHVPPKKILANLRQNGLGLDAYSKQIYNEKAKLRKLARGDLTVMQHLIGLLEEHNYYKWFRTDETTHAVIDLMWAHPLSFELLSKFPYVILLDSTYKTNQYKLPLLEIVGVTPVGKNYCWSGIYAP